MIEVNFEQHSIKFQVLKGEVEYIYFDPFFRAVKVAFAVTLAASVTSLISQSTIRRKSRNLSAPLAVFRKRREAFAPSARHATMTTITIQGMLLIQIRFKTLFYAYLK